MNLLDRLIGYFSPAAGLKRAHARKVMRTYQGAESSRLTAQKKPRNNSADQEMLGPFGADSVRAWARSLVRDNAYAWNVLDTIVSNVVGSNGINPQSTLETDDGDDVEDVNDARDALWADWCEVCDINGKLTFAEMQSLAFREMVEAGEVLIRFVRTPSKIYKGINRPVPLALEIIEADRLSLDRDTFNAQGVRERGNRVIRGVELDDLGKPVAYWIYPQHPNSPYVAVNQTPVRINASEIIHLFRMDRVGQTRGVSWFAPAMQWMRDLGVYVDNELQASAVASCFTAVIKSDMPVGSLLGPTDEDTTDSNGNTLDYLEPGLVARLRPGESIEAVNPGRPNSSAEPWIRLMLRGICAGTGTAYESVSKDFSNTSYSSSRTSKLDDRPRYRRYQNYIINHFCYPIWDEFCNAAAVVGDKNFPTSDELLNDRRRIVPVEWQTPAWEWVDPQVEQSAAQASIESFMSDPQTEIGSRGGSWRSVLYNNAKARKLRLKLGLLTPGEQQSQMMAAQTGAAGPQDEANAIQDSEQGQTGEWMGLSRLQWQRNRKALTDILNGLTDGSMSPALAKAQLSMIGLSDKNIEAIVADASDGTVDNQLPAEEIASAN